MFAGAVAAGRADRRGGFFGWTPSSGGGGSVGCGSARGGSVGACAGCGGGCSIGTAGAEVAGGVGGASVVRVFLRHAIPDARVHDPARSSREHQRVRAGAEPVRLLLRPAAADPAHDRVQLPKGQSGAVYAGRATGGGDPESAGEEIHAIQNTSTAQVDQTRCVQELRKCAEPCLANAEHLAIARQARKFSV